MVAYLKEKKLPVPWTFHDLDSAKYYQKKTPEWLEYYVDTIKKTAQLRYAIIFVSAHAKVQETLLGEGVKFMRVRPRRGAKEIYLKREVSPHCSQFCVRCVPAWILILKPCWCTEGETFPQRGS